MTLRILSDCLECGKILKILPPNLGRGPAILTELFVTFLASKRQAVGWIIIGQCRDNPLLSISSFSDPTFGDITHATENVPVIQSISRLRKCSNYRLPKGSFTAYYGRSLKRYMRKNVCPFND